MQRQALISWRLIVHLAKGDSLKSIDSCNKHNRIEVGVLSFRERLTFADTLSNDDSVIIQGQVDIFIFILCAAAANFHS